MREPWWISLIKAGVIVNLIMLAFAYTTWLERKLLGRMQNRFGPNRAGPYGLLQPFADLIKLVRKESFFPVAARHPLYIAAPIISMFTALAAFAVIPFGAGWHGPYAPLGPLWFVLKVFVLVSIFIWIRASVPRLRYDQLMRFGWKVLLPVATINAVITALVVVWVQ